MKSSIPRPVMLVILDGWGERAEENENAVKKARTATFDKLWETCPHAFLKTSGGDVGLPKGQMGNSEVGHLHIGAGRVVLQGLSRIDAAIEDDSLAQHPEITKTIQALKATKGRCHVMGLFSRGGVHSNQNHALHLMNSFTREGIEVIAHAFADGRDSPPKSASTLLGDVEKALPEGARFGTLIGRYYGMDRDTRWERVEKAYALLTEGKGAPFTTIQEALEAAYAAGQTDEFIPASTIGAPVKMRDGDALICFNFRSDRIREILEALTAPSFAHFPRAHVPKFCAHLGMVPYSASLDETFTPLFPRQSLKNVLGEILARHGKTQLRMAETEKYPHVTYFLNGGEEKPFPGEERIMVPSPKVATYDLQPEMSAFELTDKAVEAITTSPPDVIILNYANPDMVGHSGKLDAAIKAVEAVDTCLGRVLNAIEAAGGALLVTADHGNCEMMRDPETGAPHTAHTTNLVPFIVFDPRTKWTAASGKLTDLAPTILHLCGVPQPQEMTGVSLLKPPE